MLKKLLRRRKEKREKKKEAERREVIRETFNMDDDAMKNLRDVEILSKKELEEKRAEAYDRWNWETGSEEDKLEFEALDDMLKDADMAEMIARSKVILFRHLKEGLKDHEVVVDLFDNMEEKAQKKLEIIEDFNKR